MKLTDTHLIILSAAAQREDRGIEMPANLEIADAEKLVAKLAGAGLIVEVEATGALPVWRRVDETPFALRVTDAGLNAIGVDTTPDNGHAETPLDPPAPSADDAGNGGKPKPSNGKKNAPRKPEAKAGRKVTTGTAVTARAAAKSRSGSKLDQVTTLLMRKRGASIQEMIEATNWLPHTTRAVLTGLRKRGLKIERETMKDKPSIYRIVGGEAASRPRARTAA